MQIDLSERKEKDHEKVAGRSTIGRTIVYVTCPFCGVETECYAWSLAGSGKLCECGAKHDGHNRTTKVIPATEAEQRVANFIVEKNGAFFSHSEAARESNTSIRTISRVITKLWGQGWQINRQVVGGGPNGATRKIYSLTPRKDE